MFTETEKEALKAYHYGVSKEMIFEITGINEGRLQELLDKNDGKEDEAE